MNVHAITSQPGCRGSFFDCILIAAAAPDKAILQPDSPASRAAPVRSAASSPGRGLHFLFWSPLFCFKFRGTGDILTSNGQ